MMVEMVGWWPDSLGARVHRLLPSHLRPELEHHRHLETLGTISVSEESCPPKHPFPHLRTLIITQISLAVISQ